MWVLKREHGEVVDLPSVVIVGNGALTGDDGEGVLAAAMKLAEDTKSKFMVLHTAASRVGAMDLGAVSDGLDGADVVYNLGADEVDAPEGAFVIYQGSHGDRGAHRADVILPGAAYTEEGGIFVNTEGRPQMALRSGFAPGDAKENWAIIRALSAELDAVQPWDTQVALRAAMVAEVPHLEMIDEVPENDWQPVSGKMGKGNFANPVADFYLTNPIARASQVMAELSAQAAAPAMAAE